MTELSKQQQKNVDFRQSYRHLEISERYNGYWHLAFTMTFALSVIGVAVYLLDSVQPIEYLAIIVTFLYANFIEYWVHRGPMHRPFKGLGLIYRRHATQHHIFFTDQNMQFDSHKDFKAVLFPPLLITFFLLLTIIPAAALISMIWGSNICFLFIITSFGYFILYECLHTIYHLPDNHRVYRLPLFNRLRQLHQNHHRLDLMGHKNFNIIFPICDWVFGTYYHSNTEPASHTRRKIKADIIK